MAKGSRVRSQDGLVREVVWLAVVVGIVAVVLLDGMALFNGHQSAHDSATQAAKEARTAYAQSANVADAELAASGYLTRGGHQLVAFKTALTDEGTMRFTVTAKTSISTYGFRHLGRIPGLEDWVKQTSHPQATESSQ